MDDNRRGATMECIVSKDDVSAINAHLVKFGVEMVIVPNIELTRWRDCAMFGETEDNADGEPWCKRTLWRTSPDGFCSEAQRKGVDRD